MTTFTAAATFHQGRSGRSLWLRLLIGIEVFLAGGFVALMLVRQLLLTIMARLVSATAQAELLNVLDHLLPYYAAYLGALVMVGVLILIAWLGSRRD